MINDKNRRKTVNFPCFPTALCRNAELCRQENVARKRRQMPVMHFLLCMWKVWKMCVKCFIY